ncbi:MAG: copper chaperone PCu(A)C [Aestuariivirga sp.]
MRLLKELTFATALTAAALYNMAPAEAHHAMIGDLMIEHPWSRETTANADVAAGFMSITNNGKEDDKLIKATAEISDTVQLHSMKIENDVMTMFEMKDGIVIPAGQTVDLKPKSLHVMFMNIKAHPKMGDEFKGTLTFEKAGTVEVEFAVEAADAGME